MEDMIHEAQLHGEDSQAPETPWNSKGIPLACALFWQKSHHLEETSDATKST